MLDISCYFSKSTRKSLVFGVSSYISCLCMSLLLDMIVNLMSYLFGKYGRDMISCWIP